VAPLHVLLVIDGSRRSGEALESMVDLSESAGTLSVTLVYIPQSLAFVYSPIAAPPVGPTEMAQLEREAVIRRVRAELRPCALSGPVQIDQIGGASLEDKIRKRDYDVIVCGTAGWRRLTCLPLIRILFRSRMAHVEVLTSAPAARR
jgi:nucleotide-binding universal stress UspA family protein